MDAMGSDWSEDWMSEWSFSVSIMITAWRTGIVFQSLVQSGFLCLFGGNWTATGFFISLFSHNQTETSQDQSFSCLACVRTGVFLQ